MAFTIATDSPETRRLLQMNKLAPMTTPSAPRIKEEESAKSKFLNALGNEGLGVASKEAVGLAKEYGGPLMKKGWASLTGTGAAPTAEAAIAADSSLLAGGIPTELTTGMMSGSGAAGGTGMMATMGTLAPWLLGGYFGGKALGLFNKGGHVGPLYADKGKKVNEGSVNRVQELDSKIAEIDNWTKMMDEIFKKKSIKDYNERIMNPTYNSGGGTVTAGPLSKLQVKSADGETVTMSYGGTVKQGG